MYKLILVDDEQDVREGLLEQIAWQAHGFEVIATAENGREACDLVERHQPDVIVTDIQMPFMDGLQLAEWVRRHAPTAKIIILTGFDEFEYAQRAIKLHIDEYVLKPFSAGELVDVLLKVKSRIESEIADKENLQVLQDHYKRSLPLLRELFLISLISRRLPKAEIAEKSRLYDLDLSGKGYLVSVISIDRISGPWSGSAESSGTGSLRSSGNRQLQLFAVLNIAEEIVNRRGSGLVFMHQDQIVLLSVCHEEGSAAFTQNILNGLDEIRVSVEKHLKLTVTIGAGTESREAENIYISYESAYSALNYRFVLGNNRIILIDDVESGRAEMVRFDDLKEQGLIRTLKVGTSMELAELMDSLFADLEPAAVSIQDYQVYLLEILTVILKVTREAGIGIESVFGASSNPVAEVYRLNNLPEVKQWFTFACNTLIRLISSRRETGYSKLVEEAKTFMREHFRDSDLSIAKVCSHLHISAGYFSSIFKKEMKLTFVGYLMQLRMEEAKELLRSTDLKAFEIAEKTGFSDSNYFSYCFRKTFNMTPKEYRNSSRGG
ncbi:response regulator [Paenibacillus sp. P96]|uniref:Response regulator n=1 Tax=Paenibacillus zeirhizosphaerae TaxID=2987519 RepID=A0ABT9FPA8_9BACL|nr:response regulator [Paenibacillus sp. P96]MDP4096573.1 response regulator [Paenibacillus sp. P96]